MRVGEGRVISFGCVGCFKAFYYFPHPYCYEDVCSHNIPIVYKPSGMGQELKNKDELSNKQMNGEFYKTVDQYVKTATKLRDMCVKYLTATLKLNDGNIDWEDKLPEYVSVPYDGGNHPEYASNVFSTVYGVFFDKEKNICLKTEDCDEYSIDNVDIDNLINIVSFINAFKKVIGIKWKAL